MIGKKINQLATELAPVSTDLTIIGDPVSGVSKKITLAQLGAIFSGAVSFYDDLASFPATGDINVIYCAKDTKKLYLWSGSAYVEVFPSQALLDTYQLRSEKGVSNGYASLDSGGKVPISQLPSSIMEYKGTWNAATNTPTLANGTGDTGDVYICNVAGTVNFGAGPLTFAVGDYVIYSGSIWQRSSGAVGTVTSVAASITGDAIGITGSPVTTSGTLALAFAGTSSQYINGAGNLINFPTSLVTGTGTLYALTKWGFTSGNIINSNLSDSGSVIYNTNPTAGSFAVQFNGNTTTGLSYGLLINAGSNASDIALRIQNVSSTSEYFFVYGDGKVKINNIPNATTDTDTFLVSDGGFIKYRTGAELLSDIGGASASGYVPYTGATTNLDLGTHTLSAKDLVINHSSGSGVAASITKGGAGEALTVVKSSGSGNAASITGGVTLLSELHLTTDLADAYIASASNWNDAYNLRHNAVTLGTANGLSLSTQVLSLALASGSTTGALSSTDWTTFNNKQSALTNPVTGTGTTNYLPKFTGTSTIGNSNLINDASGNLGLGVTPSAGWVQGKALEVGFAGSGIWGRYANEVHMTMNYYYSTSANARVYASTNAASDYEQFNGNHVWYSAPSGTIGTNVTFTPVMYLNASGNLSIGNTNDTYKLDVSGTGRFSDGTQGLMIRAYTGTDGWGAIYPVGVTPNTSNYTLIAKSTSAVLNASTSVTLAVGDSGKLTANSTGISVTGAATFSSSVTTTGGTASYSTSALPTATISTTTTGAINAAYTSIRIGARGQSGQDQSIAITNVPTADGNSAIAFTTMDSYSYAERMRITSGGRVGIGQTNPGTALSVAGQTEPWQLALTSVTGTAGAIIGSPSANVLAFGDWGGTERMRITSVGNVGIGTTSASSLLTVAGMLNSGVSYRAGTYTQGSTTPSVSGVSHLNISNSSATSITNFTGGVENQIIVLYFNDSNTTITRNNAYLSGGLNFTSTAADTLTLIYINGYWYEVSRSINS
jgi:hypothetical protein